MSDLGTLRGDRSSSVVAVNDRGQIAGYSSASKDRSGTSNAVIWTLTRG